MKITKQKITEQKKHKQKNKNKITDTHPRFQIQVFMLSPPPSFLTLFPL